MGIQINGQTDRISAVDGSFGIQDLAELNVSGIVTAASANFTGNVSIGGTLTYQDVTNIDSVGIITARNAVVISEDNAIHFRGTAADDADAILRASAGGGQLLINSRNDTIINIDSNNDSTDAHFAIAHGAATGSSTELFRVQEDGKVAVGFNAPAVAGLSIANSSTSLGFEFDTASGFAGGPTIRGYHRPSTAYKSLGITGADIKFGINDVEKLRLDSNGYLGLNNSAPHNQYYNNLVIGDGSASGDKGITIRTQSSNEGVIAFSDADSGAARYAGKIAYNHGTNAMMFFTSNGDERLRIASDGQVYIGSSSDNSNSFSDAGTFFNLKNDTYGGRIGFSNNTATAGVSLMEQFAYWGNNKISGMVATAGSDTVNKDDGDLRFYTRTSGQAVTERLRINQAGCLQVGEPTGTPGEVMQIRKASGDVEVITYAAPGSKSIFNCTGSNRFALERGYNSVFEIQDPNGNGVRSDLRFDGNIILNKNLGDTNNSAVQLYRLIGPQNLSLGSGMAILGSQTDTMSTKAAKIGTSNNNGTAWFGPYGTIHPGSYTAMFHMKVSNNSNTSTIIRIDVTGQGITDAGGYGAHRPRSLNLAPSHFDNSDRYQYIGLDFNFVNAVASNVIEVRGLNFNNSRGADLYLDHILIVPRIPSHDG